MQAGTSVYRYGDCLYVNATNRCPTACRFCIKYEWGWKFRGWDLRLPSPEPTLAELLSEIERHCREGRYRELVFCGYGESTYRLPAVAAIAKRIRRRYPGMRVRLNTIGLGSRICGRDIVPELSRRMDAVSVSLNTADPAEWLRMHRPRPAFRERGFEDVLAFIRGCVARGMETTVTAVERSGVDTKAVARLAGEVGAGFRLRPNLSGQQPFLEDGLNVAR